MKAITQWMIAFILKQAGLWHALLKSSKVRTERRFVLPTVEIQ